MVVFAGIDLGGTNIEVALVDGTGKVLSHKTHPTEAGLGYERVIKNITETLNEVKGDSYISAIGLCSPGLLDVERGICLFAGNLGFRNVELKKPLEDAFGVPTFIENDVNAAALGEWRFGAGRGTENFILVMVGTGVGAGVICDGHLLHGKSNASAEIGHTIVEKDGLFCNCGGRGCLEMYASATGIVRMMRQYIAKGNYSSVISDVQGDMDRLTAALIASKASEGDSLSKQVINEAAEYLGIALVNYINTFNPEIVAIGGGVARAGDILLKPIEEFIRKRAMEVQARDVRIVRSALGEDAGTVGAAAVAMEMIKIAKVL
ncbi:MAG: ROK family protein [Thermoanaerobacteraceae bacterium]|nr:ROK family protein [Thermoanaerobacteraceae bacterium]